MGCVGGHNPASWRAQLSGVLGATASRDAERIVGMARMANPNPPPPNVGARLKYHDGTECEVRAIVDPITDDMYDHLYYLVVRAPSIKYPGTYTYSLIDAHALGLGLYKVAS